jgi:hypothetical protein
MPPTAAASPQMSLTQQDQMATQAILKRAVNRIQNVGSTTLSPASNPTWLLQPINVGLIKRFYIVCTGTITNSGSQTLNLTDAGLSNIFGVGGVQYTDLNNYLRVNTSGQHLTLLSYAKNRKPKFGTANWNTVDGSNLSQMLNVPPALWSVLEAPASITTETGSGTFRAMFELPLAYSDKDLRGAIWANVLTAVQQLQLTVNQNIVAAGTADPTFAIYSGASGAAGSITSITMTVYQEYLDQLPQASNGRQVTTLLPQLSLSTVYEIKSLVQQAISPNQENYFSYTNQRSFLGTFVRYNNNGGNGLEEGGDIAYWALVSANAAYLWKLDPLTATALSRDSLEVDLPRGTYYFDSRKRAIATLQFGNIQLTLNPSTANAGAYMYLMLDAFAPLNTLQNGPGLTNA